MKATWNEEIIAKSNNTVVVEGNHYFPKEAVKESVLEESTHTSVCPWKGTAKYYNLNVNGSINQNAAWYYPEPKAEASEIKNRVAFWKGVVVEED